MLSSSSSHSHLLFFTPTSSPPKPFFKTFTIHHHPEPSKTSPSYLAHSKRTILLTLPSSFLQPPHLPLLGRRSRGRWLLLLHRLHCSSTGGQSTISEEEEEIGPVRSKEQRKKSKGSASDWLTSVLLLGLWAALIFYVFRLSPDQTPTRDVYFLQKLMNLKGDDGFRMNQVLVSLWYIMGLWPLVYSMLLIPSGRSSESKVAVWPFLVTSICGGAYALIPYFVLWKPPPPPVEEDELGRWPLNFLESKITAGLTLAAGLGIIVYAGLANGGDWKEFIQYFRESKFIHITCLDFTLLTAFSPFWVFNDMAARKWVDKGSWLLPAALIPLIGPALYLLLRPPLSALPTISSAAIETE